MNIIVTGASRGIGYELVKHFSSDSSNTIVAIARNKQKLNQLKQDCLEINSSANIIPITFDLNDKNIKGLTAEITRNISSVNILINNAGLLVNKPFMNINLSDLENVYNTNVFSIVQLIQAVLPIIDFNQRAHIVNISSMGGIQGTAKFAGLSAYSSSKAALGVLTECLAEEFKEKNISFNCLALGAVQTEMLEEAFPGYKASISAAQMAAFIADFSLKAHLFMNGKIIPVSLSTP